MAVHRLTLVMVLLALPAMLAASCARQDLGPQTAPTTTTTAPRTLQEAANLPPPTAPSAEDDTATTSIDLPDPGPMETTPDITLVDREALEEQIPDLAGPRACIEMGAAYGRLHLLALDGRRGAAEARTAATQLKALLPPALHDDLDVVVGAIATVASAGVLEGGAAFEAPAYNNANTVLAGWFDNGCG